MRTKGPICYRQKVLSTIAAAPEDETPGAPGPGVLGLCETMAVHHVSTRDHV